MGPVTPTNGTISKIQHSGCVVDSIEKIKHIAKTKYIETVCVLYWVCLKLKIQTESFTLADNFGSAFSASLESMFFESTLANEHCTEAHTQNTADSPKDTGLLGTRITPSHFTFLRWWFQDCSTDSVLCQWVWNKCDYFIKLLFYKCSQCLFLSHFSNSNHKRENRTVTTRHTEH